MAWEAWEALVALEVSVEWEVLVLWEVNQDHSKCQAKSVLVLELELVLVQVL